jgi:signal transduction histidine kinase/ligand-binding sensor domain-containing protein/FixJ family two-component response regulator
MSVASQSAFSMTIARRVLAAGVIASSAVLTTHSIERQPVTSVASSKPASPETPPFNVLSVGRPSLRTFTSKDGLPQNAITSIVTDRIGKLWIGTKDGVASYNGRTWQVLNMPPEVGNNMIADIVHTATGDMWVSLHGGGVVCRRADGSWRYDREPGGPQAGLPVLLGELDEPGKPSRVVLLLQRSLATFVDGEWVLDPDFPLVGSGVAGGASIVAGDDGVSELWTGLPDGRTARRRLGVWTTFPAPGDGPADSFFCFIRTSALAGEKQLLAGRLSGLSIFDGEKWISEPHTAGDKRFDNIFRICESRSPDGSLALWCGSIDGRSYRFENGQWMVFGTDSKLKDGGVWSLLAAGDARSTHAVWIGTAGLGLVRAQFGAWTAIDRTAGLVNESVYSLLVTKDRSGGDVAWIGTISGGLVRFERGVPKQVMLDNGTWLMWVMCLLDVSDQSTERVLAGNAGNLLVIENGRVVRQFRSEDGLPGYDVTSLLGSIDSVGRPFVWVGTAGGVCRLVGDRLEPAPPGLVLPSSRVTCMAETTERSGRRNLWIGTDRGLFRFDGERTDAFTMKQGLPTDAIMCLREIRLLNGMSELWAGTRAGVARIWLEDTSAPVRTLSTQSDPPLPNNTVYRIEADAAGRLYLPTNRGVARLTPRRATPGDPGEFDLTVFTTDDGLPNDECNTGASTIDHRGRIWIGTLTGAAVYDPAAEIKVAPSRLVVEKQLVVDDGNRQLVAGDELAHDRNHLVFEYALLSYNREAATRYRTQLDGYEPRASEWTTEFRREFNSLPAGSYVFRVWGRDAYGGISGPIEIGFEVESPPWLTWWAIAFYVFVIVALGYIGIRWRLRTLAQRNVLLESAIAQRTAELAHTVDELRVSQQMAQEANLAKSLFLANMSHELRTPLNAVLGFAQLLDRTGSLGPTERHKLGIIRRSGEHLLGLINDVLSLAKIEAGRLELHEQPFSPAELLASVEAMTRVRADAKDLHFDVVIGDGFPMVVHGDDGKLRQVLLNLLGNAVKFTDSGGIRLVANWSDGCGRFEISDEGCGISASEMTELFQAFSQTSTGKSTTEGTGLGLTISRQIVRLMGGDITVESEPGKGSTFRFDVRLPATGAEATARTTRRVRRVIPSERRRRILVVDDSPENRLLLASILTSVGFDVREAADGREAVDVVVEWRPRVIFMDRRMPVMDGVESTREIRRLESLSSDDAGRVVIIATTASVFEQDREEILANGCNDLVIKPFQEAEIFEMLQRHAGVKFEFEDAATAETPLGGAPSDALSRVSLLDAMLVRRLYQALDAGDTQAAIEIANEIGDVDRSLGDEISRRIREFKMEALIEELERVMK